MATIRCASCSFESHWTSIFCISCGRERPEDRRQAARRAAELGVVDEAGTITTTAAHDLVRRVIDAAGYLRRDTESGLFVEIPLVGDRRQSVHIDFGTTDEQGDELIAFTALCGPVDEGRAMTLLRMNSRLSCCKYAVRTIGGEEFFAVTAAQLAHHAQGQEVRKMIESVAARADQLEGELGGEDRY